MKTNTERLAARIIEIIRQEGGACTMNALVLNRPMTAPRSGELVSPAAMRAAVNAMVTAGDLAKSLDGKRTVYTVVGCPARDVEHLAD